MTLPVQGVALNICLRSRNIITMVCFCSITKEVAKNRPSRRRCKRASTVTLPVQHGVNGPEQLFLSPELEVWVWSNSPHVDDVAGWKNRQPSLRSWMIEQGLLEEGKVKPRRPKEALQAALREARIPRSSSLYQRIAEKVSLRGCEDRAFLKFKDLLKDWFPRDSQY